ncbi:MAG: hypothetical protein J0L58_15810 [Burkholderiales bacterium]|nr:hypothetical protein [Burkholderiales bacterium]
MPSNVDIVIRGRNEAEKAIRSVEGQLKSLQGIGGQILSGFGLGLGAGAIQTLTAGVASAVRAGAEYNATLQSNTMAFKTLLGSMDAAQRRMDDLSDFAATTPFELPQVVRASVLLQTLTDGAMAAGDQLRIVGDAAAASGRSFEETAMWIGRLYAGLQSGTPVGEATMRLLEMGLISGDAKRELDGLAESGGAVGKGMEIVEGIFRKTTGAMAEQAKTAAGLRSTLSDTLRALTADAVLPAWEKLQDVMRAILESLGAMPSAADAFATASVGAQRAIVDRVGKSGTEAARLQNLDELRKERQDAAAALADAQRSLAAIAEARRTANPGSFIGSLLEQRKLNAEESTLRAQEEALARQINAADVAIRRLESVQAKGRAAAGTVAAEEARQNAYVEPAPEDLFWAMQEMQADAAQARMQIADEDQYYLDRAVESYRQQNRLIEEQNREKEHAVELAAEEARIREEQRARAAYSGSYTGGTAERWERYNDSAAVDGQAGVGGGMVAGWQNAIMDLGTVAENAGLMIQRSIGGAIDSVSAGISGLIQGTTTWGQALRQIGGSIINSVIDGIVRMFAAWIFQSRLKTTAETANATQEAAAKAPGALMESIGSWGIAAAVGAAAFLAAMALSGGFRSGGYTGDGSPDEVAGVVHRGEYIVPAERVRQFGVRNLEAMTGGGDIGRPAALGAGASARGGTILIHNHIDDESFRSAVRDQMDRYVGSVFERYS